jgi:hypothetical protein
MTDMKTATAPTRQYHPKGGWDQKRKHPDGISYWRNGELHNANGFAVFRADRYEAWLFGHHLPTPDHRDDNPLYFGGQTKSGKINWLDDNGDIRAVTVTTSAGIHETRWYDYLGDPEPHWRGEYHVRRMLVTGETRYYKQPAPGAKPVLHRVDGPAIEDAKSEVRSIWCLDGARVLGPLELLIKHTVRAQQAADHGRPILRLDLTDQEKGRLRITVIMHPDSPLSTDVAIAFPDEFHEAISYLNES